MGDIRIHEKPNAVPNNAAVFVIEMQQNGVWYTRKVTWEQLVGLIGALNNLQNYYLKTETYTKTEVNQLIAQIPSFTVEIVQELPTEDISTSTLYLVPKTTAGTLDYYDEFINLDGTTSGWEYVGKTEVDLSNYYTKAETEAYVKGDGADYIAGTKTFSSLTTTAKTILGAINEAAGAASGAQTDATQALADASAAQGTANSASSAASAAQGTADNALTAAGNAASAASAAQGTANTALTTAQSMAVSVTNTLTPGDTTKKVADVTQNSTTTSIYADDAEKVVVALTDTQTATGNPVTITTAQAGGAKSAIVTFSPKQSGTGDPSPSNIRPFILWDGLELTRTGKNLLKNKATTATVNGVTFTVNDDGTINVDGTASARADFYIYGASSTYESLNIPSGDYIVSGGQTGASGVEAYIIKNGGGTESFSYSDKNITIDATKGYRMLFRVTNGTTVNNVTVMPMIRLSTVTDPTFAPYNSETYTVTFESPIAGGEYDFVSGKGSFELGYKDLGDITWIAYSGGAGNIYASRLTDKAGGVSNLVCSAYANTTATLSNMPDKSIKGVANDNIIYIRDTDYSTAADFIAALSGVQCVYELATPTEISLTPADVELNKGTNVVSTDGDTVQVTYSELPNGNLGAVIDYIQKLEARVKALES